MTPRVTRGALARTVFVAAIALIASAPALAAQRDFDAQTFRMSPHALDYFQVESARVAAGFTPNAGVAFHLASGLLQIDEIEATTGRVLRRQVLDKTGTLQLFGSLSLHERISLAFDLPLHVLRTRGSTPQTVAPAEEGFALGDLGFSVKLAFLRPARTGLGLGASVRVGIPTGKGGGYTAESGATAEAKFLVEAAFEHFRVALNTGYRFRPYEARYALYTIGNEVLADVGFGIPLAHDQLEIIAENTFSTSSSRPLDADLTRDEVHAGLRWRHPGTGLVVSAGGGRALIDGLNSPEWRVFVEFGYRPARYAVFDSDGDGILDDVDRCVHQPEDRDNFQDDDGCPDLDNDGDGIPDTRDKCPNEAEDRDNFQDDDGCPDLDNDGDGIPDAKDKCPNQPELRNGFEDEDGCPETDSDGDGIFDAKDQCPNEAEDRDNFQDDDGCPDLDNDRDGIPDAQDKCPNQPEDRDGCQDDDGCPEEGRVCVTEHKVVITDKIYFATGKAKILPKSYSLLDEIAKVLIAHPEILKVEIQGHTDSRGSARYNKRLSQRRARAVRKYLIRKGVDRHRLVARGYGEERPIAPNDTEEGRAKNRRVEFVILERAPKTPPK